MMESRQCASAASDHSDSLAVSHEQHCSQGSQQMVFNSPPQSYPHHHVSGHSHVLPQQSHVPIHQQQYITAEQSVHYGQTQPNWTDYPTTCSAVTAKVPVHGPLTVQPNSQSFSDVNSHQRHAGSHEPSAMHSNMPGPVTTLPGQVYHSPKAMHQNMEGMTVSHHMPVGNGQLPHGRYYPVPEQRQHISNNGQVAWQSPWQYRGQSAVPHQVYVSGAQARFNTHASVPFRVQHPHYAVNQDYGGVPAYCQQYYPGYCEGSGGSPRGTFVPQQQFVGPNGQRMFARPSTHAARHHARMPVDAQYVYCAPQAGGNQQQPSPSWSVSAQMAQRTGVPVGYGNQPWPHPMPAVHGSPVPGQQHMSGYHPSPEPRMNQEICDNFGGPQPHTSPLRSFPPRSMHYRPFTSQSVHADQVNASETGSGASHVSADGSLRGTPVSQEYTSCAVSCTNTSMAAVCTATGSDISAVTHAVTPSHPLQRLPDGRQLLLHHSSELTCNHPGHHVQGTNINGSWCVSSTGHYYSCDAGLQYVQQPYSSQRVSPYNYYVSTPRAPYLGTSYNSITGCGHPYADESEQQGEVANSPVQECRNVLPVSSHQQVQPESLMSVAITACSESASVMCTVNISSPSVSSSAPVSCWTVDGQKVHVATTSPTQTGVVNSGSHVHPLEDNIVMSSSVVSCTNYDVLTCTASVTDTSVTFPASSVDSTCKVTSNCSKTHLTNKHVENIVVTPGTTLQNIVQVTSSSLPSNSKSTKGLKRSGSQKAATKTKKKKRNFSFDNVEFCSASVVAPCSDAGKRDATKSLCAASDSIQTASLVNTVPAATSLDHVVTSIGSEHTAIVVPYGWRRHLTSGTIVYYSPSNICLRSHDEVRQYLLKEGTCKCGLQCPLVVDKTFVFNAQQKLSKHLLADDIPAASDQSNSLCNHRRKIIAMATFQQSAGFQFNKKPETTSAVKLPVSFPDTRGVTVTTSVDEVRSQSSEPASASLAKPTIVSLCSSNTVSSSVSNVGIGNQSASGVVQHYGSHSVGSSSTSSGEQLNAGPTVYMQYGSAPAYGYSPVVMQPSRMVARPNESHHPAANFQATTSPSYRQMVAFAPRRMPYPSSCYERHRVPMANMPWGGNVPVSEQCRGGREVSSAVQYRTVDLPPAVSDSQEPVQAPVPTRTKKKSRSQQKEPYSSILERSMPCPNIDVRQIIQEERERLRMEATSVAVPLTSAVWSTSPATSAFTLQQLSSQNSLTPSAGSVTSAYNDSITATSSNRGLAASEDSSVTSIASLSSTQLSCVANSSGVFVSVAVTSVFPSHGSGLPCVAMNTIGTDSSNNLHVPATSMSRLSTSVYTEAQHNQWSQFSSHHPLSCVPATKSLVAVHQGQFDYTPQGPAPYAILRPNVLALSVTSTACVVANSSWLPTSATDPTKDESPIQLVQNMVSGLETTQNSLAMATSLIIGQSDSAPRRRRSGVSDTTPNATAVSLANSELCDEHRFDCESLNTVAQTSCSVTSTDDVRCTQVDSHLPTTSAFTTVTSVLTQALPSTNVAPSAYCVHMSAAVVSAVSCSYVVGVTATSSANSVGSIVVSGSSDTAADALCHSTETVSDGGAARLSTESEIIDDDESTQDCDISVVAGTDLGEILCTTGTQTSTPASAISNCNSVESGADGSESSDTGGPVTSAVRDDTPPAESQRDAVACSVQTPKPSAASEEKPLDDVRHEQMPIPASTPLVLIPRVPQASFLLPQNIAFAPNPLVGHGFLQFQSPGEFSYGAAVQSTAAGVVGQPSALGLVHFAAGPVVGPNMMTTSDANGPFRLMTPVKSDGDAYSGAEFLPLMPAAVPAGPILLQNIMPTGLASTIVPFMQPAALCSLPGANSAVFAMNQGSLMSVGTPLAFASVPVPGHHHKPRDHVPPDQPDSTVDNSEMDMTDEPSSDDSADTEQVTSTDEPLDEISDSAANVAAAKLASTSSVASSLHCGTSQTMHSSLTQRTMLECASTLGRTERGSVRGGDIRLASASHSAVGRRSLVPRLTKRARLHRSRFKKMHGGSTVPGVCSSQHPSMNTPASISIQSSDVQSIDTEAVTSGSSVSNRLSLHDSSSDGTDAQDRCGHHVESVQKARWTQKALARRTKLRLRRSKHEAKPAVNDAQLSPAEITSVEDVADSTTGSVALDNPRMFKIGDLVWGPIRGFPSWPGKLVAESEVRGNHKLESGKIWVKWFGDHTFTQADPDQLNTLSEGLETHHNARKKDRQGRKMNSNLEAAIQEAMTELDRQMAAQSAVRLSSVTSERNQKAHDGKRRK